MSKVNDFCLLSNLNLLVVASSDKLLRIFEIKVKGTDCKSDNGEIGDAMLELKGHIVKESSTRTLQLSFDSKRSLFIVLSSDNKLEIFKVINSDNQDSILKKLIK